MCQKTIFTSCIYRFLTFQSLIILKPKYFARLSSHSTRKDIFCISNNSLLTLTIVKLCNKWLLFTFSNQYPYLESFFSYAVHCNCWFVYLMNIVVLESFVHISWSRPISSYPWINYENRRRISCWAMPLWIFPSLCLICQRDGTQRYTWLLSHTNGTPPSLGLV